MRNVPHPPSGQLDLSAILDALADPIRRRIVLRLAAGDETACGGFSDCAPKTNLSYHFAKLREAGLIKVRQEGTQRFNSLRRKELEERFPGLLDSVIRAAERENAPPGGEG